MSEFAPEQADDAVVDEEEELELKLEASPGPTEDTVGMYLREISQVPLLTAAEEVRWRRRWSTVTSAPANG
jgi:hypothetical protein